MRRLVGPGDFLSALDGGGPLRLQPNKRYELPSTNFSPKHPVDLEGDGSPIIMARGSVFRPDRPLSFRFRGLRFNFRGTSEAAYVVALQGVNHPMAELLAHDCDLIGDNSGGLFGQADSTVPPALYIHRLSVRNVRMRAMSRALVLHCAIGAADIDGLWIDGYKRFGCALGPLSESRQRQCQRASLRNVHVWNGDPDKFNSAAIYVAGRHVSLSQFSAVGLGNGLRDDTEGLYFKVDGRLDVSDGLIHNCGGEQGMAANKGTGDGKPRGGPVVYRRVVFSVDPGRPGAGIWHQTNAGEALYEDISTVQLSGPAFRVINSQPETAFTFRRWTDISPTRFIETKPNGEPSYHALFKVQGGSGPAPCSYRFEDCQAAPDPTLPSILPADRAINNNGAATVVLDGSNSWE